MNDKIYKSKNEQILLVNTEIEGGYISFELGFFYQAPERIKLIRKDKKKVIEVLVPEKAQTATFITVRNNRLKIC